MVSLNGTMNLETKSDDWYIESHSFGKGIGLDPRDTFELQLQSVMLSPTNLQLANIIKVLGYFYFFDELQHKPCWSFSKHINKYCLIIAMNPDWSTVKNECLSFSFKLYFFSSLARGCWATCFSEKEPRFLIFLKLRHPHSSLNVEKSCWCLHEAFTTKSSLHHVISMEKEGNLHAA